MNDETDYERAERILGPELRVLEKLFGSFNPETMFHAPKASRIIDLQRRYDIALNRVPTLYRFGEQWEAIDRVTFDHDPTSRWHIVGRGSSTQEATSDLLEKLGAEVAKGDA